MSPTHPPSVAIVPVGVGLGLQFVLLVLAFGLFRWVLGRLSGNGPSPWRAVGRLLLVLLVGPAVMVSGLAVPRFLFGTPLSPVPSHGLSGQVFSTMPEVEVPSEEPVPDWAKDDSPHAEDELVADSGRYSTFDEARQQVRRQALELTARHWPPGHPEWSQVVVDQYSTQAEHDFGTFKAPMYRVQWLLKWPLVEQHAALAATTRARELDERMIWLLGAIAVIAQLAALFLWLRETAPIEMASFAAEPDKSPAPQAAPGVSPAPQAVAGLAVGPAMPVARAAHQSHWYLVALGPLVLVGCFLAFRLTTPLPPPPKPLPAGFKEELAPRPQPPAPVPVDSLPPDPQLDPSARPVEADPPPIDPQLVPSARPVEADSPPIDPQLDPSARPVE